MAGRGRGALVARGARRSRRIWDCYVGVAGQHTAENVLREIAQVIALIEDRPFAGRARDEVRPGLRSVATAPHVVFYRVVNDRPEIVCVLDGRQDIEEKFAV